MPEPWLAHRSAIDRCRKVEEATPPRPCTLRRRLPTARRAERRGCVHAIHSMCSVAASTAERGDSEHGQRTAFSSKNAIENSILLGITPSTGKSHTPMYVCHQQNRSSARSRHDIRRVRRFDQRSCEEHVGNWLSLKQTAMCCPSMNIIVVRACPRRDTEKSSSNAVDTARSASLCNHVRTEREPSHASGHNRSY